VPSSKPKTWLPPEAWLERIIRIDSQTHKSNWPVIEFLLPHLERAGLNLKLHRVIENGVPFFNVVAHNGSLHDKRLLVLHTHLDTVAPGPKAAWTKTGNQPFRLTADGDRRYGLGAADVKLDFLCKLWAVMQSENLPPLALVGTYGEERGLVGARKLLETSWFRPKFAMVGEPSLLEIIYAHKGHLVVQVSLPRPKAAGRGKPFSQKGKAAHSSTPDLGKNAIEAGLLRIVGEGLGVTKLTGGVGPNTIPAEFSAETVGANSATVNLGAFLIGILSLRKELGAKQDARFNPSRPTVSVNQVTTREKDFLFTFDVRLLPSTNVAKVKASIAKFVKASGMKLESMEHDPGLDGGKGDELIRRAQRALTSIGVKPQVKTKASCTEAALYNEKGAQAFVFGPGRSIGNVHKPNEYNQISQLKRATQFYHAMVRSFAAGDS